MPFPAPACTSLDLAARQHRAGRQGGAEGRRRRATFAVLTAPLLLGLPHRRVRLFVYTMMTRLPAAGSAARRHAQHLVHDQPDRDFATEIVKYAEGHAGEGPAHIYELVLDGPLLPKISSRAHQHPVGGRSARRHDVARCRRPYDQEVRRNVELPFRACRRTCRLSPG